MISDIPAVPYKEVVMGLELFHEDFLPSDLFAKFAQDMEPGRVMELGCSTGKRVLKVLSELGWDCVGIDIDARALKEAAQYGTVYLRKGEEPLHFLEDNSFDLVCALNVFHHVEDVEGGFSESIRCLKSGGVFLIIEQVEDSLFLRLGRNVFQEWEGMPVLSRMRVQDWLALFSRFPVNVVALYARSAWVMLPSRLFYLFSKVPFIGFIGKKMLSRYWRTLRRILRLKKHAVQMRNYAGVATVLFVLQKSDDSA